MQQDDPHIGLLADASTIALFVAMLSALVFNAIFVNGLVHRQKLSVFQFGWCLATTLFILYFFISFAVFIGM